MVFIFPAVELEILFQAPGRHATCSLVQNYPSGLNHQTGAGEEQRKVLKSDSTTFCFPSGTPCTPSQPSLCRASSPAPSNALHTAHLKRKPGLPDSSVTACGAGPFGINQQTQTAARCFRGNRQGDKML